MKSKRLLSQIGRWLDPFLILGVFFLFLVPVITLTNLTPGSKPPFHDVNVLGTQDQNTVRITPNDIAAEGIILAKTTQTTDNSYTFYLQSLPHAVGIRSNLLFSAVNGTSSEKTITVTSYFEDIAPGTVVSLVVDDVSFVILDADGTMYPPTIYVEPGDTVTAYIKIESSSSVNFTEGFSLDLAVE